MRGLIPHPGRRGGAPARRPAAAAAPLAALCLALLAGAAGRAAGQAPPPPASPPAPAAEFERGRIKGKAGETLWFRFEPGNPGAVDLVQRVLGRYGLAHGQHYWCDRHDPLGLLAVTGEARWIELIRSVLGFLAEEQPQVRVKVRILETYSSRDLQSGVETGLDRKTSTDTFFRKYRMTHPPKAYSDSLVTTSSPFTGTTAGFGTVETVDAKGNFLSSSREREGSADLALRVLGEHQTSKVLAEPDLLVLNGVQASISTGQNYPYQKVLITGSTARVEVENLHLGVTLNLTPFVVGEDRIHLVLEALVENQAGWVETGPGTKFPFTSRRSVKTSVLVPSGYEVVVGGLFQKEFSVVEKGVPLLSDIPLVGYLFKSYWRVQKRRELVFFIRPLLVGRRRFLDPEEK
ncbi:MAG: type II and III secretion system protein [Planctomycetes bacterium]|nr:type II and III secretion system protein [Planctomycetota bacterium]